jgi:hypothetical protein
MQFLWDVLLWPIYWSMLLQLNTFVNWIDFPRYPNINYSVLLLCSKSICNLAWRISTNLKCINFCDPSSITIPQSIATSLPYATFTTINGLLLKLAKLIRSITKLLITSISNCAITTSLILAASLASSLLSSLNLIVTADLWCLSYVSITCCLKLKQLSSTSCFLTTFTINWILQFSTNCRGNTNGWRQMKFKLLIL